MALPPIFKLLPLSPNTVPARFSAPLANQTVVIGSRAVIECRAEGDAPVTVRWFRNQRSLDEEEDGGQRYKVGSSIWGNASATNIWERGRESELFRVKAINLGAGFFPFPLFFQDCELARVHLTPLSFVDALAGKKRDLPCWPGREESLINSRHRERERFQQILVAAPNLVCV